MKDAQNYGIDDTTYRAVGGRRGIRRLVGDFYNIMQCEPRYRKIFAWHPQNIEVSCDKLTRFLCGWMGGPERFTEKYGPISIPLAHLHLPVTEVERDLWLDCMACAISRQDYSPVLMEYLNRQLFFPAERIRQVCMGELQAGVGKHKPAS